MLVPSEDESRSQMYASVCISSVEGIKKGQKV